MMSENLPPRQISAQTVTPITAEGSYLDWSAILAGAVFALAISFILLSFGAGLGLSLASPYRGEGVSAAWLAIASGIWFIWVMVTSFGAGGYLAGRMRRRIGDAKATEVEVRDGTHGLMVWAIGALVSTVVATTGIAGLVGAGASAVGSTVGAVADAASEAASSDYFANLMLRSNAQGSNAGETADEGAPPVEGTAADADTATPAEDAPSGPQPVMDTPGIDPAAQQQVASIIGRSIASGDMAARDRSYLAQIVAANTDMDEEAARARVDEINTEIADIRSAALEAVETARVAGVVFGFVAAATLLIGAIAAFFTATAGGHHRDEGLELDSLSVRR